MKDYPNVYVVTENYNPVKVFYQKSDAEDWVSRTDQRHNKRVVGPFRCS